MHILFLSVFSENVGKRTVVFINYNQVNFTGSNNFTRNIGSVIEVSERVCKANPSRWVGLISSCVCIPILMYILGFGQVCPLWEGFMLFWLPQTDWYH